MDKRAFGHTCHHEAGHAFMRWFVGIDTDFVEVLPGGSTALRHDEYRSYRFRARTAGSAISYPNPPAELAVLKSASIPEMIRSGPLRAELALLVIVAGVVAEARYRRRNEVAVWLAEGARSDFAQAEDVVRLWLPEVWDPIETACIRARALLRLPAAVAAVGAIAETLGTKSRLGGAEIAALCDAAFDGRPGLEGLPPSVARFEGALSSDGLEVAEKAFVAMEHRPSSAAA